MKKKSEKLIKKSFEEHYTELRKRLLISALIYLSFSVCFFVIAEDLYKILSNPLSEAFGINNTNRKFIFTGLTEGLSTQLQLSLNFGFIASLPFIIMQFYLFLAPGLYKKERIILIYYILSSITLCISSIAMVYFFVIPSAWKFFLTFESFGQNTGIPILLEPRISEYLDLILELIVGFAIAFQLPIIIVLLISFNIVKTSHLVSFRRYAIVILFIIAAILTPPDVLSQIILALPLLLLYEISIVIGKLIEKKSLSKI